MRQHGEMIEDPEAAARMDAAMRTIFSVSREEIQRREAEYKKLPDAKPAQARNEAKR